MAPANKANKKAANSLVALSSAAVLAVYAAGYVRTRSAADRFALQAAARRPAPSDAGMQKDLRPAEAPLAQEDGRLKVQSTEGQRAPVTATVSPRSSFPADAGTPAHAPVPEVVAAPADAPAALPVAPVAPVSIEAEQKNADAALSPSAPPHSEYKDGTYLGWGHCRHGDIQASVVIAGGRIASATIAQCLTRYSCSVIDKLPPEVAQRQSPDVDTISGATQSGDAFYYAVTDALLQAK